MPRFYVKTSPRTGVSGGPGTFGLIYGLGLLLIFPLFMLYGIWSILEILPRPYRIVAFITILCILVIIGSNARHAR